MHGYVWTWGQVAVLSAMSWYKTYASRNVPRVHGQPQLVLSVLIKRQRLNLCFLNELSETKIINWKLHVFKNTLNYNLIIGRDLLQALGILLDFKNQTITWDKEVTIPVRDLNKSIEDGFLLQESEFSVKLSIS